MENGNAIGSAKGEIDGSILGNTDNVSLGLNEG